MIGYHQCDLLRKNRPKSWHILLGAVLAVILSAYLLYSNGYWASGEPIIMIENVQVEATNTSIHNHTALRTESSSVRFKNMNVPYQMDFFPEGQCAPTTDLFVMVMSSRVSADNRQTIRRTWAADAPNGTVLRFFVADAASVDANSLRVDAKMSSEQLSYGDLIRVRGFVDNYDLLFKKIYAAFEWQQRFCASAKWILKTDEDTAVFLPRLRRWIDKKFGAQLAANAAAFFGWAHFDERPHRDPKSKWYVSKETYPLASYPRFVAGPTYLGSSAAISAIMNGSREVDGFRLEDVLYTGVLAERANVSRHDATVHFSIYQKFQRGRQKCEAGLPLIIAAHWGSRMSLAQMQNFYGSIKSVDC